jgi:hypothetical protein
MKKLIIVLITLFTLISCEDNTITVMLEDGQIINVQDPNHLREHANELIIQNGSFYRVYGIYNDTIPLPNTILDSSTFICYHKGVILKK